MTDYKAKLEERSAEFAQTIPEPNEQRSKRFTRELIYEFKRLQEAIIGTCHAIILKYAAESPLTVQSCLGTVFTNGFKVFVQNYLNNESETLFCKDTFEEDIVSEIFSQLVQIDTRVRYGQPNFEKLENYVLRVFESTFKSAHKFISESLRNSRATN